MEALPAPPAPPALPAQPETPALPAPTAPVREPEQLPLLWMRSTVVFPMSVTPLAIVHPAAIASVNRALAADRRIVLAWQPGDEDGPTPANIKRVGTLGVIRQMARGQLG